MKKTYIFFVASCLTCFVARGQRFHLGLFGGLAAYNGDLTEEIFPKKVTNGAIGITGNYELTDKIILRGGLTYAVVGGADRFSDDQSRRERNLAFETSIWEFSAVGEYYFRNLYEYKFSPYIFGGLALYHYDPYAFNGGTTKIHLRPLSTEGQGLPGYGGTYSLTQMAVPFGLGVKYALTENIRIGLEGSVRLLFTDYLDDVSTNFADQAELLAARGQLAIDMSYRGDELPGGDPAYPVKGYQRGSPKYKDLYYFTGLHVTYRINGNGGGGGRGKKGIGCPVNVY